MEILSASDVGRSLRWKEAIRANFFMGRGSARIDADPRPIKVGCGVLGFLFGFYQFLQFAPSRVENLFGHGFEIFGDLWLEIHVR
jgi:hypothetical protein